MEQKLLPAGHPNRPGTLLKGLYGLVVHYTANDSPKMGADANIKWIGRTYIKGESGKVYEVDGKTPFRFGSAHVFCDMHKTVQAIPFNEVAYAAGDARLQWTEQYKGQQPIAHNVFAHAQNHYTISWEICNNDEIKNSDADWLGAVAQCKRSIVSFCQDHHLQIDSRSVNPQQAIGAPSKGKVLLLRHYDLTGKQCPAPFIQDSESWIDFIQSISKELKA